jgi:O-antigen ligase
MKNLLKPEKIALFTIALFPIFALLIKGWVSTILFLSVFISVIYYLNNSKFKLTALIEEIRRDNSNYLLIAIPFSLPILIVIITSVAKGRWDWADLDGPARYLLSLFVLFFLIKSKQSIEKLILYTIPLLPIFTLLLINFVEKKSWSASSRLTIYFIDPIIFGSLGLTFGLLSLICLFYQYKLSWKAVLYFISALSGFYLCFASESRTGWFAIPVALFFLVIFKYKFNYLKALIITGLIVIVLAPSIYHLSDVIRQRSDSIVTDLKKYRWNEVNEDTSAGERISYMRMGWYYMTLRPLTGWENLDFLIHKDDPQIAKHASPEIRLGVKGGGFHSEYITNAVKYGVGGFLYTLILFIGPCIFFVMHLKNQPNSLIGLVGLIFIIAQSISSLTYQVLDFKFTASLYAMMIVSLAAAAIHEKKHPDFK